ncbi:MAG: biotin/lipoyl-binding carrier protein [Dehalococcoidia bacterium]
MAEVLAPMAGTVFEILVAAGDAVAVGDELLILESMKMEIPIEAPSDGTVTSIAVEQEQPVQEGDLLLTLD